MKRIFSLFFILAGLAQFVSGQTLTITTSSVEVITSGAKTRAFYSIDDVFIVNTSSGSVTVKDAGNGTVLFSGDTSEVTISGLTLWEDKIDFLAAVLRAVPNKLDTYPITFLPRTGLNYLYKTSAGTVTVINSRTKYSLWTGDFDALSDGADASNTLNYIRTRFLQNIIRGTEVAGKAPTAATGAAAGSGATVAVDGFGASGTVTLTTGTSATTTGVLCTITLPVSYDVMFVHFNQANVVAGTHISRVTYAQTGDNTFTFNATGTALSDSTPYKLTYFVTGYNNIND